MQKLRMVLRHAEGMDDLRHAESELGVVRHAEAKDALRHATAKDALRPRGDMNVLHRGRS